MTTSAHPSIPAGHPGGEVMHPARGASLEENDDARESRRFFTALGVSVITSIEATLRDAR